jgi:calcineurin-like phosphoesterase
VQVVGAGERDEYRKFVTNHQTHFRKFQCRRLRLRGIYLDFKKHVVLDIDIIDISGCNNSRHI